mmetsp:Transcript_113517/g.220010  ORF Transcript_113517/g.220010 Transcript_113517/m.220010 type:complete len:246 (-) Transcript_113517:1069-1806(-)
MLCIWTQHWPTILAISSAVRRRNAAIASTRVWPTSVADMSKLVMAACSASSMLVLSCPERQSVAILPRVSDRPPRNSSTDTSSMSIPVFSRKACLTVHAVLLDTPLGRSATSSRSFSRYRSKPGPSNTGLTCWSMATALPLLTMTFERFPSLLHSGMGTRSRLFKSASTAHILPTSSYNLSALSPVSAFCACKPTRQWPGTNSKTPMYSMPKSSPSIAVPVKTVRTLASCPGIITGAFRRCSVIL